LKAERSSKVRQLVVETMWVPPHLFSTDVDGQGRNLHRTRAFGTRHCHSVLICCAVRRHSVQCNGSLKRRTLLILRNEICVIFFLRFLGLKRGTLLILRIESCLICFIRFRGVARQPSRILGRVSGVRRCGPSALRPPWVSRPAGNKGSLFGLTERGLCEEEA
jgi:hypothetical protein